jgi:tetraacyldisaccharide 4'-kinase
MLRFLLYPLAILYDMVTTMRNTLYDRGSKPSASFDIPVISVGNLAVGGTGKTPMIEYLIRLLSPPFHVATLSRGYGRATKGFRIASNEEDPLTIGDEPNQLFRKFGSKVKVTVGEERALAIPLILQNFSNTEVILLDDAFQHRTVRPAFQILLTDYKYPFYKDVLLPAGRLRESRKGAARADIVVITKCPHDLDDDAMMIIEQNVRRFTDSPVFFSCIRHGEAISFGKSTGPMTSPVIAVSGLANAETFVSYLRQHFQLVKHYDFSDHYVYKNTDVENICREAKKNRASVITTEKDAVKLQAPKFQGMVADTSFFYLPIENEFLKNGKEFDAMILNVLHPKHSA